MLLSLKGDVRVAKGSKLMQAVVCEDEERRKVLEHRWCQDEDGQGTHAEMQVQTGGHGSQAQTETHGYSSRLLPVSLRSSEDGGTRQGEGQAAQA